MNIPKFIPFLYIIIFSCLVNAAPDLKAKVSPQLWNLVDNSSIAIATATNKTSLENRYSKRSRIIRPKNSVMYAPIPTFNKSVIIKIITDGNNGDVIDKLQSMGADHCSSFGRVVSAQIPVSEIPNLQYISHIKYVKPSLMISNSGRVTNQCDIAQYSDIARKAYNLSGTGIRVGILSDSFDNLGGMNASQASGDLSSDIIILKDYFLGTGILPLTDEGRAMAEIINDVAPNAALAFYTAWYGEADFANGILALRDLGCKVIVDDVIYLEEPMFADGIIAQAADMAANSGVAYISSAGNAGENSYYSEYRNSGTGGYNNFSTNSTIDTTINMSLNLGTSWFVLQWPDNYASAGVSNPGAKSDLDLEIVVYANDTRTIVKTIMYGNDNNIGLDPVEIVGLDVGSQFAIQIGVRVRLKNGPAPSHLKLVWYSSGTVGQQEYSTRSSTIYGHMNAAGAMAVGAVRYCDTPAYGKPVPVIENWSSIGGTPIFNNSNYIVRQKPNFCAPQGGNTTFFGDRDYCGPVDEFPNFYGTSASAPAAAGVIALMLESNPNLNPTAIQCILQNTSTDMRTPGFDYYSGYGLINAKVAIDKSYISPPSLERMSSRKQHGDLGEFDISTTNISKILIDGRISTNLHLIFTFNKPILSCNVSGIENNVHIIGKDVYVDILSVTNKQTILLEVSNILAEDLSFCSSINSKIGILYGDVDRNGLVGAIDVYLVRSKTGIVNNTNFVYDLDCNGILNSVDVYYSKFYSGQYLK